MKTAFRPALYRLCRLDQMVRNKCYPNARSVARELGMSPRTLKRDFSLLKDAVGSALAFSHERNGYYYREKVSPLPPVRLSEGELVAFYLTAYLLPQLRGTTYGRDLQRAFDKLTQFLPQEITVEPSVLAESLSVRPTPLARHDVKVFEQLTTAIHEQRRINLDYWTASRDVRRARLVDPYHVTLSNQHNIDLVFLNKFGDPYARIRQTRMGSTAAIRRRQLEVADTPDGLGFVRDWVQARGGRRWTGLAGDMNAHHGGSQKVMSSPLVKEECRVRGMGKEITAITGARALGHVFRRRLRAHPPR